MKKLNISTTIQLILLLSLVIYISACSKKLDAVIPQSAISSQLVLSDSNAAQTLYTGVYSRFRTYNSYYFLLGEMRSEIWADGLFTESADGTYQQLYNQNVSKLNVPFDNWCGFYNLIYQINNVITLFPQTKLSSYTINKEMAEMYGLRAYVYYRLLQTWGAVPLDTTTITSLSNAAQTYKARSSEDSVMLLIKSDIQKSLDLFGTNNTIPSGNRVYWNRVATLALKGDAYLWSASLMNGGTTDYTNALNALTEIKSLQGSVVDLDANYTDIFDPTKKSGNKEILFAINYELSQVTQSTFSEFQVNSIQANSLTFTPGSSSTVSSVYPYVSGSNRAGMTQALITKLTSDSTDTRISNSFKVMYSLSSPYSTRGIILTKWLGSISGTSQVYNNDFPIYRYADILLMLAEAKTKLGQDPSVEINQIRNRAHGSSYLPYVSNTPDSNMHAILEEGLREFIGEGKRWTCLRRAGDKWVYNYINPKYLSLSTVTSGSGPTLQLPISVTMLNNDPLLTQTVGY